jgi:hypothetical protein
MTLKTYVGVEFRNLTETGRKFQFQAQSVDRAVAQCLCAETLRNRPARTGPTGKVVYVGDRSVVFAYQD